MTPEQLAKMQAGRWVGNARRAEQERLDRDEQAAFDARQAAAIDAQTRRAALWGVS